MAYETRKLVMAATGGFLIAVLIISGFVWMGILPVTEAKGLLLIKVKDDPASLEELWLNITAVKVHRKGGGSETWYDVPLTSPPWFRFDLLEIETVELAPVLAVGQLQVGNYTEIRFYIADANATIDGVQDIPLQITTKWVMVKIHFTIEEDTITSVVIDIEVNEQPILKSGKLIPVAKASVEYVE